MSSDSLDSDVTSIDLDNKNGYPELANMMGKVNSAAIFRRFAKLSVENLLYMQADLTRLENLLREIQKEDKHSGHKDRKLYSHSFKLILLSRQRSKREGDGNSTRQLETILRIRARLKEYHEALLLYYRTFELTRPHQRVVDDLHSYMHEEDRGWIFLTGEDRYTYRGTQALEDLVGMHKPTTDPFNDWVTNHVLDIWHSIIGRRVHNTDKEKRAGLEDTIVYSTAGVQKVTRSFTIMVASMLPILSTIVLYFVEDTGKRLWIITGFTALFSLALGFFTRATLQEIFSATAAFAAVSVVWIGTTSTNATPTAA